jgi:PPM family protein phosphatase
VTRTIEYAALSDLGRKRRENQDRWFADPGQGLFLVADGMGGRTGGGLAAEVVIAALPPLLQRRMRVAPSRGMRKARQVLRRSLVALSRRLRCESQARPGLEGMGSTVVLALIRRAHALIAHMGDSRAYLWRDGRIERLTRDHSIAQLLLDSGDITPTEATSHPGRGQLTRFVGMEGEALPEVTPFRLRPGDWLLLCSDGLTGMLSDERISGVLREAGRPQAACRRLIDEADAAGGNDNITVLIVAVEGERIRIAP